MSEWVTVGEAAQIVGVSPGTLRRWDRSGRLVAVRHPISGFRMYLRDRLDALVPRTVPRPEARLLGRVKEAAALDALAAAHRLVVISGPPGIGKTRLLASRGASWIQCSEVTDPPGLQRVVASALGVAVGALPRRFGAEPTTLFLDHLDNAVQGGVPRLLTDWLRTWPTLRVVATSRVALRVPDEGILSIGPLDLDAGVALFRRHAPEAIGWDTPAIRDLVRRHEGNPLAIELTAATAALVGPRQMPTLPADPTIHDAVQASLQRLEDRTRRGLMDLLPFRGGFTAEAAVAVLGGDGMAILQQLKRASLLRSGSSNGVTRHAPWGVVRDVLPPPHADAAMSHARWLVQTLSQPSNPGSAELDNVRAALANPTVPALLRAQVFAASWQVVEAMDPSERVDHVSAFLAVADPGLAARLHNIRGCALMDVGRLKEGLEDFDRGLALPPGAEETQAGLHLNRALLRMRFEHPGADLDVETAITLAEQVGSDRLLARALLVRANASLGRGEREAAMEDLRAGVWRARRHGLRGLELSGTLVQCRLEANAGIGRLEDALRVLALARELGGVREQGYAAETVAMLLLDRGELQAAGEALVEARDLCARWHYDEQAARASIVLAVTWLVSGRAAAAEEEAHRAEPSVSPGLQQRCIALRALAAHRSGRHERAQRGIASLQHTTGDALIGVALELVAGRPMQGFESDDALARILARLAPTSGSDAFEVAADGSWFQAPGRGRVDLEHRPVLAAMLRVLHESEGPVNAHDLAARTWSDSRWVGDSGVRRVRSAIWTLRKLGLRGALHTRPDGYELVE